MKTVIALLFIALSVTATQTEFFDMVTFFLFYSYPVVQKRLWKNHHLNYLIGIRTRVTQHTIYIIPSRNSVDRVLGLLTQMLQDAQSEQEETQAKAQKYGANCVSQINSCEEVITKAKGKVVDDQNQMPLKEEEFEDKQQQAEVKNGEEQRNKDRIQLLTEQRAESRKEYEENRDELVGMIAAIQEAKQIIKQLKPSSFLQESQPIFAEIKDHHNQFMKSFPKQRGYHQLVNILLQTATDAGVQADKDAVEKIMEIMDEIVESLYEVQKREMEADDAKEADFITQKTRLEVAIAHLAHQIASLNAAVLKLQQQILELQNDINANQNVIDIKSKEERDWVITCQEEQKGFKKATENRAEEIEVLQQVLAVFNSGFSDEAKQHLAEIQID